MHARNDGVIEGRVFRWTRGDPLAKMRDTRAFLITAISTPVLVASSWAAGHASAPTLSQIYTAPLDLMLAWVVSALILTRLLHRTQAFFRPDWPHISALCTGSHLIWALLGLIGTPFWPNVQFTIGSAYLSIFLFVGGSHPVDRYINAGWAGFVVVLFTMLIGNAA